MGEWKIDRKGWVWKIERGREKGWENLREKWDTKEILKDRETQGGEREREREREYVILYGSSENVDHTAIDVNNCLSR